MIGFAFRKKHSSLWRKYCRRERKERGGPLGVNVVIAQNTGGLVGVRRGMILRAFGR